MWYIYDLCSFISRFTKRLTTPPATCVKTNSHGWKTHTLVTSQRTGTWYILISNLWYMWTLIKLLYEFILQCWAEIWQSYSAEYVLPRPYQLFHLVGDFDPLKVQQVLQIALFSVLKGCDATQLPLSDLSCVVSDIWSISLWFLKGINHFQASTNRLNELLSQ